MVAKKYKYDVFYATICVMRIGSCLKLHSVYWKMPYTA